MMGGDGEKPKRIRQEAEMTAESGDGARSRKGLGDTEFILLPLLAVDPLPFLFNAEGDAVDINGDPVSDSGELSGISAGVRQLQREVLPKREPNEV